MKSCIFLNTHDNLTFLKELCDLLIFLAMQSLQVKGSVREARHISEVVLVRLGYLKKLVKLWLRVSFIS